MDSWRSGTSTRKLRVALRAAAYPTSTPKPTAPQPFQYHHHRREHGLSRSSTRNSRPGNGGLLWRRMSNGPSHVFVRDGFEPCAGLHQPDAGLSRRLRRSCCWRFGSEEAVHLQRQLPAHLQPGAVDEFELRPAGADSLRPGRQRAARDVADDGGLARWQLPDTVSELGSGDICCLGGADVADGFAALVAVAGSVVGVT